MNVPFLARKYAGKEPRRLGLAHPSIAPYGVFSAADGDILISIQNEREWAVLAERILGNATLVTDPKTATNTVRVANREFVDRMVGEAFRKRRVAELAAELDEAKIAYGRVSTMAELIDHRSLTTVEIATPEGPIEVVAPPVIVDGKRPKLGRVPALGEHDAAIRREFATAREHVQRGAAE